MMTSSVERLGLPFFLHARGHTAESMQQKRGRGTRKEGKLGETRGLQSFRSLLFLTALGSSPEI